MKRSDFLRNLSLLGASSLLPGIDLASFPVNTLSFSSYNHRLTLDHQGATVKIHAIATGQVKVRKSHRSPALGIPQILLDPRWTEWMPVYCWVIEHPEGNILIDTGENARVRDDGYFDCDPTNGWVNKRILRFDTQRDQEIDRQLAALELSPKDIRWVVLTHLHLDHVDGLHHFPQAEIYVSEREWHKPYGDVPCLRPPNFRPQLVKYSHYPHFPFEGAFPLTQAQDIWLIPTPGHTHGHQSVLFQHKEAHILFAGDVSFSQEQLLNQAVAGICAAKGEARKTYRQVLSYAQQHPLVYLPSHDPGSGLRLSRLSLLRNG